MPPPLCVIRQGFISGWYNITTHGYEEMANDGITVARLEAALGQDEPEIIEDYPNDERGPCCLILAWADPASPIHAVVGYGGDKPDLVTAYGPPNMDRWREDYRTRR